jgi:hypothetical protein
MNPICRSRKRGGGEAVHLRLPYSGPLILKDAEHRRTADPELHSDLLRLHPLPRS